jgi:hypothetical protein
MSENSKTNLVLLPNSPTAGTELMQQMLTALQASKSGDL